jgi:hypothetical protein
MNGPLLYVVPFPQGVGILKFSYGSYTLCVYQSCWRHVSYQEIENAIELKVFVCFKGWWE